MKNRNRTKRQAMYSRTWRNSRWYRIWRIVVIMRGDHMCEACGGTKKLHAHHIKHATYYKSLRYDVRNGVCLCQRCHIALHSWVVGTTRMKCTEAHLVRLKKIVDVYLPNHKGK